MIWQLGVRTTYSAVTRSSWEQGPLSSMQCSSTIWLRGDTYWQNNLSNIDLSTPQPKKASRHWGPWYWDCEGYAQVRHFNDWTNGSFSSSNDLELYLLQIHVCRQDWPFEHKVVFPCTFILLKLPDYWSISSDIHPPSFKTAEITWLYSWHWPFFTNSLTGPQGCWRQQTSTNWVNWKRSVRWAITKDNTDGHVATVLQLFCDIGYNRYSLKEVLCDSLTVDTCLECLVSSYQITYQYFLQISTRTWKSSFPWKNYWISACNWKSSFLLLNYVLKIEGSGRLAQCCRTEGGCSEVCCGTQWRICRPGGVKWSVSAFIFICLSSISKEIYQVDKFKPYPDLMAELFKAMARSPPTKRRKWRTLDSVEHFRVIICNMCFSWRPRIT